MRLAGLQAAQPAHVALMVIHKHRIADQVTCYPFEDIPNDPGLGICPALAY